MHIGLIGPYMNPTRQNDPGSNIIRKGMSLIFMKSIYPATVWFFEDETRIKYILIRLAGFFQRNVKREQ